MSHSHSTFRDIKIQSVSGHTLTLGDDATYKVIREYSMFLHGDSLTKGEVEQTAKLVLERINNVRQGTRTKIKRRSNKPDDLDMVIDIPEGTLEDYGDLPTACGQMSRFAVAWWADNEKFKHVRFFGDRIHVQTKLVSIPRLIPFGQEPYFVVFPANDPMHCLGCRAALPMGKGIWRHDHFICEACSYQEEMGLRPAVGRTKKKG
jgi:hypothetical protein